MEKDNKQRVIVYIDGFNFYYGLKKAPWKKYYWLDIVKLHTFEEKESDVRQVQKSDIT